MGKISLKKHFNYQVNKDWETITTPNELKDLGNGYQ